MADSRVGDVVAAAVNGLRDDSTLTSLLGAGTKVATHVPKGTDPPFSLVMGGDELPWAVTFAGESGSPLASDGGDNGSRQVDVIVQISSTYPGSTEVDDIASQVMSVLTDDTTWSGVSGFQLAEFVRNAGGLPLDVFGDGVLWFLRTVTVRVYLT